MATELITYRDRSYHGDLEIEVRGDFLRVEYTPDGYNVESIYIPAEQVFFLLRATYGFDE